MQILTIGRNPENRLVLNDPNQRVSNFHAELKLYDDGRITLLDKSFNGTTINGRPAPKNAETPLHRGDAVLFANVAPLDWNRVPPVSATPDLKHSLSIGRNSDNTIPIPHDKISRYHAVLRVNKQGKMHLQDQSHNGTFVNGVRISPYTQYPVNRGDAVSFANVASLDWNLVPQTSPFTLPAFDFTRFDRRIYYGVAALALLLLTWLAFRPNQVPSERYRHSVGMIAMRFYVVYNNASKPVLYFGPGGGTTYQSTASELNIEPFGGTGSGFFVGDEGLVVTNRHVATPWESTCDLLNELFNLNLTNPKGQRRPLSEQEYQYYNLQGRLGWSYKLYVSVWVVYLKDAYNGLKPNFKGGRHARLGIVPNEASINVKDYMDVALPCQLLKTAPDINVDLGLLQLDTKQLPEGCTAVSRGDIINGKDDVREGDEVTLIGFPKGMAIASDNVENKLEASVLSSKISQVKDKYRIQYNANTEPGTSGAPVFNQRGQLVAVNYAGSTLATNYNFGILASHVRELLK